MAGSIGDTEPRHGDVGHMGPKPGPKPQILRVGSYPSPFFVYLLFYITDPNHKTRYPKKGVGYEPLGKILTRNPFEERKSVDPKG